MTRIRLATVVLLSVGTTACGLSPVEVQYQHVLERTTPPQQSIPRDGTLVMRDLAIEATWEMQTDLTWEQYTAWVARRLAGDYIPTPSQSRTLAFSKSADGDRYAVTVAAMDNEQPLRLRLQFRATPD